MLVVDVFQNGKWVQLGGQHEWISNVMAQFPNAQWASGPEGHSYGIGGKQFYRARSLRKGYDIYSGDYIKFKSGVGSLYDAKNAVAGQTIWFEPNKDGVSYGIGSDGRKWTIKEVWTG